MFRFGLFLACLTCLAAGPSAADLSKSLREAGLDPDECYRVRDLSLEREDIKVYFGEGYLIFTKPFEGERRAALFTAQIAGGDGEVLILPPYRGERQSLAEFTKSANLDEHFDAALLIFTDGARDLVERLHGAESVRKVPEIGALLAEKWNSVVDNVRGSLEMRILIDILGPRPSSGMTFTAVQGRTLGSFDVVYDPRSREQIEAGQLTERNNRPIYNVWTSFAARSVRTGRAAQSPPWFSVSDYRIDAALDSTLSMKALTRAKIRVGDRPLRGFPFDISRAMHVTSAKIDGVPAEVFAYESVRGRALRRDDNDVFLVVAPDALAAGSVHQFEFEHEGEVITRAGNNVFYVAARATWYPRYTDNFAAYDLTFHYPKRLTLVAPGDQVSDATDGDVRVTRWRTPVPIRMAGFNLGDYEKISGNAPGFTVDVYGNKGVESALMPKGRPATILTPFPPSPKGSLRTPLDSGQAQPPPDPRARLREVASDVSSSLEFFASKFGPPALKTLTVAPIPGAFGQGFPGLVYLSTLSYLDPSQRPALLRGEEHQVFFSELIAAHEVAHQWWGNVVTASSYQDEWIPEALANYSSLLFLERKKGAKAMESVLDSYRDHLVAKNADGRAMDSAGPITWGSRLDSSGIDGAWRVITYEKGAWIVHMLRSRLGSARFFEMLAEARRRYQFKSMSTADLRALVEEFAPPRTPSDAIANFFDNWVYSTGIPTLKLKYSTKSAAQGVRISGTIAESGVDDDFSADVPVEIQFAKGEPRTLWVRASSDGASFSATVRQMPTRVTIGPGILERR